MKHNKYSLSFLLACFATAASLAGCTWDSSLYDDFVNKNTDSVMTCEGRIGITLPNGVYAYYDKDINKYYCGTYDELKTPTTCQQYIENILNDDPEGKKIKEFGFSSFEEFEAYFEKITRFDDLCPANTESCFKLEIQPSVITILCNACLEGTVKIKKDGKIECSRCPIEEHYVQETKMCEKDDEENCGEYGYACKDHVAGWKNGECRQGKCFATGCEIGYDLNNEGICEAKTSCPDPNTHYHDGACIPNNLENCGQHAYACAANIAGWINGDCKEGKCEATKCDTGYELIDGRCEARISCTDPNTHYYNGECMVNDMENCGKHNHRCDSMVGWANGDCTNGVCVPSECQTGYHLDEGSCVADDNKTCGPQKESCGQGQVCTQGKCSDNCGTGEVRCEKGSVVSCADPNTSTTFCGARNDDSCKTYETCAPGQACVGGECVQNSCTEKNETLCVVNGENVCINVTSDNADHCGACNLKCSALLGWEAGECKAGKCVATECKLGYCLDSEGTCADGQYNSLTCGANGGTQQCTDCTTSTTDTTKTQVCVMGICRPSECEDNTCFYQSNQGTTCSNTAEHCGKDCVNCNTNGNASKSECSEGSCKIIECATGYHLTTDQTCELNTPKSCGSTNKADVVDCKTHNNASDGYCENGQCVATSCDTGYHVVNGACVNDSKTACGASATDCTKLEGLSTDNNAVECKDGKCNAKACQQNYHLAGEDNEKKCVRNSETACGSDSENCESISYATRAYCDKGMCYVVECTDGYKPDNQNNQHGTCQCDNTLCNQIPTGSHIKTRSCHTTDGSCRVTECEENYHIAEDWLSCEENTNEECASTTSNEPKNCPEVLRDDTNIVATKCESGSCRVEKCNSGYHLANDGIHCAQNYDHACAPVNSSNITDCTENNSINPNCGDTGECCRANDSGDPKITSKPTCCNNNCLKKTSGTQTFYQCSDTTNASGSWIPCQNG